MALVCRRMRYTHRSAGGVLLGVFVTGNNSLAPIPLAMDASPRFRFCVRVFAGSIRASTTGTLAVVATGGFAVWFLTIMFLSRIPTESAADPKQIDLLNQLMASVTDLKNDLKKPPSTTTSHAEQTERVATVESAIQNLTANPSEQSYTPSPTAPKWLRAALGELGQPEYFRILEYFRATDIRASDAGGLPWSAAFTNWCLASGGVRGTRLANSQSFLTFGRQLNDPREGCLVILHRGDNLYHSAFFLKDVGSSILAVSGNVENAVRITAYPKDRVVQYRYPNGG